MAGPRKSGPPKAGEAPQRHSHCLPGSDLCKELGSGEVDAVPVGNASLPPSSFAHAASDRYEISPAPNLNVGLITRLCFSPNKVQVPQSLHQAQAGTMPVGKVPPSGVAPDRTEDRDPGDDIELPEGIIVDDYLSQMNKACADELSIGKCREPLSCSPPSRLCQSFQVGGVSTLFSFMISCTDLSRNPNVPPSGTTTVNTSTHFAPASPFSRMSPASAGRRERVVGTAMITKPSDERQSL
jgi:hypothetical protein